MTAVVRLADDEVEAAGAVLARAFFDDPLFAYMLPDHDDRRALGPLHFTPVVRLAQQTGEVWRNDDFSAVACWQPPGTHEITPEAAEDSGLSSMADDIGLEPTMRIATVFLHLDEQRRALDVPEHWYLSLFGVDSGHQGRGVGGALVRSMLARLDAAGIPAYLETMGPQNVGLYEHLGFELLETDVEPSSGLPYWLFLRAPHSPGTSPAD